MKKIIRNLYHNLACRLYTVGKKEYEKRQEEMMFERGIVGENTRFYLGAELCNYTGKRESVIIGDNCHISGLLLTFPFGGNIRIGNDCSLSPYSRIVSVKRISIGNRVLIAHNVNIIDNISHPIDAALRHQDFIESYSTGSVAYDTKAEDIVIGDDVWIGFNSTIMRGVTIGNGAIIGAGSFVTKDVQPWTVNVGNPLKTIRELSPVDVNSNIQ